MQALVSVVDDDDSVREALESLIRSVGLLARVFASAEQFLESAAVDKTACLVLDVLMPGMSGIELHRDLLSKGYRIPVIFMTAHASGEDCRAEALSLGGIAYLIKPFRKSELLDAIFSALKPNERQG
jgi:FixJ family two-component response regulator